MANSKVPQFGSWGADDNVGYTAYFETARKGKGGGPLINPNEPQMNSDVVSQARPAAPARPQPTKPESKQPKFGDWEAEEEVPYTVYFENTRKGKGNPNDPQMNRDAPPQARPAAAPQPTKPEPKQPKFGEWEAEEEVPYTAYFENPGKGRRNPNEPQMNRDVLPSAQPATPPQPTEAKQPKFGEWDAAEEVPYTAYFENPGKGRKNPNEPQMNRDMGPTVATKPAPPVANPSVRSTDPQGRPNAVKFAGGMQRVEQSPIHPRAGGRGAGSQPSSFESVQGTPGRAGQKTPTRGAQNPVRGGASIPAFGDWNKNPDQAEGYTVVFGELQKDRREGAAATPSRLEPKTPPYSHGSQQQPKGDCFSRFFSCFSSSH